MPGRPTIMAYGRTGACRCGMGGLCFVVVIFQSLLSSFSNASSIPTEVNVVLFVHRNIICFLMPRAAVFRWPWCLWWLGEGRLVSALLV